MDRSKAEEEMSNELQNLVNTYSHAVTVCFLLKPVKKCLDDISHTHKNTSKNILHK